MLKMKIKIDFITNSSSANFTIPKKYLTKEQILMIHSHIEIGLMIAKRDNLSIYTDEWYIKETKDEISGRTSMDNFDMLWFLDMIHVDRTKMEYQHSNDDHYYWDDDDFWDDDEETI